MEHSELNWFPQAWQWVRSAPDWGTVPQWATVLIALCAFIAAIVSIRSQREVARKRAATDFFLKTEMDTALLQLHEKYLDAIDKLKMIETEKGEVSDSFANTPDYWAIRNYLNLHELCAVGILNGVFDEGVCYDFWSGELVLAHNNALPLIKYVQKLKNSQNVYAEMEKIAKRWAPKRNVR
ncbi:MULTISPECIES: DUF4760 domain-containing protein [unclassified Bradyrhizobium]|uniref:DUF4760 domain-containing protein n=1 Tax=unclassified Bradyrhizobium TaxID=2631580 RepID=UPI0024791F33|nr:MULTISPECIES: DUF4760 domain-containing protein [unclassified Bradyrhizobium]WGR70201.1 DUF4760 domain-containing protein [Bradyrhizobium sp. ISRA426]WGR82258.1 DUF4760 domain-containing protein [Bradyrhizobium sp. ISRA430]WGR85444.1 DUF4760 domain-containing protein [Bradyrhizobium sp. ISRA432]